MKRAISFKNSLIHNTTETEFMQKILDRQHAKSAPMIINNKEIWYLPLFSVYHSKMPNRVRIVFDSFANDVLMKGPPLYNTLLGILLRFRRGPHMSPQMWNICSTTFLLLLNIETILEFSGTRITTIPSLYIDYHMNVHVLGNSLSPAVATYRLFKRLYAEKLRWWLVFLSNSWRSRWSTRPDTVRPTQ